MSIITTILGFAIIVLFIIYGLELFFYIGLIIITPILISAAWKYIPVMYFLFKITGDGIIGIPKTVSNHWIRQTGNTCAIAAQQIVLKIFNMNRPLDDLAERQRAYGHYKKESGSNSLSFLLTGYDIKTEKIGIDDKLFEYNLWKILRKNRILIVAVNSFVLNKPDSFRIDYKEAIPDHAIIISGIEEKNGDYIVYYSDTGIHDGRLKKTKSKHLLQAISKKSYYMIATESVPEEAISQEDKREVITKESDMKVTISCPACNQKLRVPNRKIIVTCKNCTTKFEHPQ